METMPASRAPRWDDGESLRLPDPPQFTGFHRAIQGSTKVDDPMRKDSGELRIDWENHIIRRNGSMIFLSAQDWALLELLARQEGQVIASEKIARTLWPLEDRLSRQDNLKHYIYRLRSRIESDPRCPQYLQTVPGQGYRFQMIGVDPANEEDSSE